VTPIGATSRRLRRSISFAAAAVVVATASPAANQAPAATASSTVVLLVRHAEKAAQPPDDPPLTAEGRNRAEALAAVVRHAQPTTVITSDLRRTIETAEPSATAAGVTSLPVAIRRQSVEQHVARVAAAVREHPGEAVLVVGHDNTVPLVIAALGGPTLPPICEQVFDRLFVLVLGPKIRLIQTRYGPPSLVVGPSCD
jgi:broad specificity phosphatase PhoE